MQFSNQTTRPSDVDTRNCSRVSRRGELFGKRLHHPPAVARVDEFNEGDARQLRRIESIAARLRTDVIEDSTRVHGDDDVVDALDQLAVSPVAFIKHSAASICGVTSRNAIVTATTRPSRQPSAKP